MSDEPHDDPVPLSELLYALARGDADEISVGALVDGFGPRAFGALLFVFAFACTLPLPPGASTVFGAPLVLLAPQVALGALAPWLPKRLRQRSIPAKDIRKIAAKLAPATARIEKISGPRLGFLFGPIGERAIGVVCTALALVLILPIPLGNMLPAAAVCAFALALVQRDGVLALIGYLVTIASTAVLVVAAHIVVSMVRHLLEILGAA
ncbi:exopolysaccharide biosynthesis protein [Phenylobacterium sp.]|uniref:exopolysaccharide biosynthesis protein n=1 Tax=Phenylobacterium sp. TaxID=1871053 RepID=UPI002732FD87|nr:exopolysaccharide biosynthesis protein [Phenylobacterium sp.]MDP3659582.1 exopolysaccharide biosynthesis protein [Phenylobacterium sp.]